MRVSGRLVLGVLGAVLVLAQFLPLATVKAQSIDADLIISKVRTGPGAEEYVELYNSGSQALDTSLGDWRLEYLSSTHDGGATPTRTLFTFTNQVIAAQEFFVIKYSSYVLEGADANFTTNASGGSLAKSGGSVRIVNGSTAFDLVGWSNAAQYETQAATSDETVPISRCAESASGLLIDSDNNLADFMQYQATSLRAIPLCPAPPPPVEPGEDDVSDGGSEPTITSDCEGVILNELLPNPGGSDTGQEFIELYNPTDQAISLRNCQLQTSAGSFSFTFGDQSIAAGHYTAFYDEKTSLTLTNSAGGTVWLLDHNGTELNQVDYPADLEDDVTWARFGSAWQRTYTPTAGAENILQATKPCPAGQIRNTETNRCINNAPVETGLGSCPPGKVRNPETNRCRSSSTDLALAACPPGKERNPLTNRCRSSASVLSALKPCAADQFRNPETNRCKKVDSLGSLKACKTGQERNAATNRCRKVSGIGESDFQGVKDVPAESITNKASWWFAGAGMVGAVSYAAFEWRREFWAGLSNLKSKFTTSGN